MFDRIKYILGLGPKVDYAHLRKQGAIIIDVRSKPEFKSGHIRGATNIPLQNLQSSMGKVRKDKPIITCCASGMRSATARRILKTNGCNEVYNGGGWMSLRNKIRTS